MSILEKTRAIALFIAATASTSASLGCSLVIESRDQQCSRDADCAGFEDAVCDVAAGVCIPVGSTGSAGCVGPDGCYACEPERQEEFLNACTDAECIPFDNAQLEGLLQEDGTVPPVP